MFLKFRSSGVFSLFHQDQDYKRSFNTANHPIPPWSCTLSLVLPLICWPCLFVPFGQQLSVMLK